MLHSPYTEIDFNLDFKTVLILSASGWTFANEQAGSPTDSAKWFALSVHSIWARKALVENQSDMKHSYQDELFEVMFQSLFTMFLSVSAVDYNRHLNNIMIRKIAYRLQTTAATGKNKNQFSIMNSNFNFAVGTSFLDLLYIHWYWLFQVQEKVQELDGTSAWRYQCCTDKDGWSFIQGSNHLRLIQYIPYMYLTLPYTLTFPKYYPYGIILVWNVATRPCIGENYPALGSEFSSIICHNRLCCKPFRRNPGRLFARIRPWKQTFDRGRFQERFGGRHRPDTARSAKVHGTGGVQVGWSVSDNVFVVELFTVKIQSRTLFSVAS